MIVQNLKLIFEKNKEKSPLYIQSLLKEQLQYYVLNYIYNSPYGENFLFKGGTCLRFCFDLPRLSEDLDFDVLNYDQFNFEEFEKNLTYYFKNKLQFEDFAIKITGFNKLIYLQFPVLSKIGIPVSKPTKNVLFIRVDLAPVSGNGYKTEISMKSTNDFSFLMKRYSLSDLFVGKISAILQREKWEGKVREARFKGRDYFDLWWFLEKKTKPNMKYLQTILQQDEKSIKTKLLEKVNLAIQRKEELKNDLLPFFADSQFVINFINNLQGLTSEIEKSL
ncbi:MAG: nucleotidyl transferase AbiEii/AbiGii toxin family protein [bacterium]|nr:nucleotidyl transferase AbiEii/AbiGii toxin family protein [bacterium]